MLETQLFKIIFKLNHVIYVSAKMPNLLKVHPCSNTNNSFFGYISWCVFNLDKGFVTKSNATKKYKNNFKN